MERWLVELRGAPHDLDEIVRWFPDGEVYAFVEGEKVYLSGSAFNGLKSAQDVQRVASAHLDDLFALVSLFSLGIQKPLIGVSYQEAAGGKRLARHVLAVETARFHIESAKPTYSRSNPTRTQAQLLLAAAKGSPDLRNALLVWSDPNRTWPRLYTTLEGLEAHLKGPVSKAGFCSDKERTLFRTTSNTAAAGIDSRHARGTHPAPKNPMTLEEGVEFVRRMIEATLRHEAGKAG